MKRRIFTGMVVFLILVMAGAFTASAAEVHLWGSTTCQKRFLEPGAKALEEATDVYKKICKIDSTNPSAWMVLGTFTAKLKKFNDAENAFRKAYKLQSSNIQSAEYLAQVLEIQELLVMLLGMSTWPVAWVLDIKVIKVVAWLEVLTFSTERITHCGTTKLHH